jgi:hypothetical protein
VSERERHGGLEVTDIVSYTGQPPGGPREAGGLGIVAGWHGQIPDVGPWEVEWEDGKRGSYDAADLCLYRRDR